MTRGRFALAVGVGLLAAMLLGRWMAPDIGGDGVARPVRAEAARPRPTWSLPPPASAVVPSVTAESAPLGTSTEGAPAPPAGTTVPPRTLERVEVQAAVEVSMEVDVTPRMARCFDDWAASGGHKVAVRVGFEVGPDGLDHVEMLSPDALHDAPPAVLRCFEEAMWTSHFPRAPDTMIFRFDVEPPGPA